MNIISFGKTSLVAFSGFSKKCVISISGRRKKTKLENIVRRSRCAYVGTRIRSIARARDVLDLGTRTFLRKMCETYADFERKRVWRSREHYRGVLTWPKHARQSGCPFLLESFRIVSAINTRRSSTGRFVFSTFYTQKREGESYAYRVVEPPDAVTVAVLVRAGPTRKSTTAAGSIITGCVDSPGGGGGGDGGGQRAYRNLKGERRSSLCLHCPRRENYCFYSFAAVPTRIRPASVPGTRTRSCTSLFIYFFPSLTSSRRGQTIRSKYAWKLTVYLRTERSAINVVVDGG